jgi:single-stranded-DNA-specific exonuclease
MTLAAPVVPPPAEAPARERPVPRLDVPPAPVADVLRLERELGVSHPMAQVLVRRGLGSPEAARAWLAGDERHEASAFRGIDDAVAVVLRHVAAGTRITVHGDYDVDGVCSTAILVRVLRRLGASVDWFLPSRSEDGYGLSAETVERLAARGTRLLLTADCAITAVDEVAAARALGLDVVVTDHHAPRADGRLPDAPIVHPALCGYPCPELCAAGVAFKLAGALLGAAGRDPAEADEDLDLVALATVCDVVALRGENRRLVRAGLRALAGTGKPGLRALMRVTRVDPATVDARALGFRLGAADQRRRAAVPRRRGPRARPDRGRRRAPRGRRRARPGQRRAPPDEQRSSVAAEAQVAEQGDRAATSSPARTGTPAWSASSPAGASPSGYHRPRCCIALGRATGTGLGPQRPRLRPSWAGSDASPSTCCATAATRPPAGLEIGRREDVAAFRARLLRPRRCAADARLRAPVERVDAVVAGDELGLALAEELAGLAPFGNANPEVTLLVPAARLTDARPMGEGKHVRFTVESGGVRARAVAFGTAGRIPCDVDGPVDATFSLEVNEWNGAVEPRLVLRHARPSAPPPIMVVDPAPAPPVVVVPGRRSRPRRRAGPGRVRRPGAADAPGPRAGARRRRDVRPARSRRGAGRPGGVPRPRAVRRRGRARGVPAPGARAAARGARPPRRRRGRDARRPRRQRRAGPRRVRRRAPPAGRARGPRGRLRADGARDARP